MNPPLIGLTTTRLYTQAPLPLPAVSEAYVRAVRRAGGLPVLIPVGLTPAEAAPMLSRLDGLLFTGGGDIDPQIYNGQPHEKVYDVDADRDTLESALVQLAAERGLPFLAICRGIQILNVALGGSLYSHIDDQLPGALKHDYFPGYPRDTLAHSVELEPDCSLVKIMQDARPQVNSLHHQGLARIAAPLKVLGHAPDGLVEAVELAGHPFGLGVQWHPEWLPEIPEMRALFLAFIQAAGA